jgi:hypothetical protein
MISVLIGTDVGLASMTSTTGGGGAGASFFPQEAQSNAMTGKITMGIVARIEPLKACVFFRILAGVAVIMEKGHKTIGAPYIFRHQSASSLVRCQTDSGSCQAMLWGKAPGLVWHHQARTC